MTPIFSNFGIGRICYTLIPAWILGYSGRFGFLMLKPSAMGRLGYSAVAGIKQNGIKLIMLLLFCLLVPQPAYAFDTGHHSALTREALQQEGFAETPIQIVQVHNWLVDYFSSSPTSSIEPDVAKLHFDNLFTTEQIRNYWGRLTVNTRNAVQQSTREKDAFKLLTLLGVSLHAVQDFYSHSNWVETYAPSTGSAYRPISWFDSPPASGSSGLYTGSYPPRSGTVPHGDYTSGLNKDSYVRPKWDIAYVFAYAASRQWVNAVSTWVNEVDPTFWKSVQSVSISSADRSALNFDLEAAYRLSEWVAFSGADGHWKGNGSGSASEFLAFAARWTGATDSQFVKEFKVRGIHRLLIDGLTSDGTNISPPSTSIPNVPRISLNQRAIIVRTVRVAEKGDVGVFESKIDPGGQADFYGKVTVAGQSFVEAMQLDKASVSPAWTTIKFLPATTAQTPILYELWDEDGGTGGDDDHCDINPARGVRDLNWNFVVSSHNNTGNITGVHDSPASAVTSEGSKPDSDRAIVQFYVTERPL